MVRKKLAILFTGALVAGLFSAASPAQAEHVPSSGCTYHLAPFPVTADGGDDGRGPWFAVCIEGEGAVGGQQNTEDPEQSRGFIAADGDDGNSASEIFPCADGYIGVELSMEDGVRVVGSPDGRHPHHDFGTADELGPEFFEACAPGGEDE